MISSSKCEVPAKHQHVPERFWSLTDVVGIVITSVKTNFSTESVATLSFGASAKAGSPSAAVRARVANLFIKVLV